MVTVLFSNGSKTFTADQLDQWGTSDYQYLIKYLERWLTAPSRDEMYYLHKVKTFSRKLSARGYLIDC